MLRFNVVIIQYKKLELLYKFRVNNWNFSEVGKQVELKGKACRKSERNPWLHGNPAAGVFQTPTQDYLIKS